MNTTYRRVALWAGVALLAVCCTLVVLAPLLKSTLRAQAIQSLQHEFGGNVKFQSLDISLLPSLHAVARGIVLGGGARQPLIQMSAADAHSGLLPWHVRTLQLQGLSITVPDGSLSASALSNSDPRLTIAELIADKAHVEILPGGQQTTPLKFDLLNLRIANIGAGRAADFSLTVVPDRPRARIEVSGRLGPWNSSNGALTPLQGQYTMPNCDVGELMGLAGSLKSKGRFHGVLQRTELEGDAQVSSFVLSVSGSPEPLRSDFHATVNATDGSAIIEKLNGVLQNSSFTAHGTAPNISEDPDYAVLLDLSMTRGRLEDVLPLVIRSRTPPLSGALRLTDKLKIARGDGNLFSRLRSDADFTASNVRFAALNVREQLRRISRKGSGHPDNPASGSSVSNMRGHLRLKNAAAQFTELDIDLEDASARLRGQYQIATERLDLHGQLWMAAKLSQTATGLKSLLLKFADPFFRGQRGGSQLPIKITGTRTNPSFGLDIANKK